MEYESDSGGRRSRNSVDRGRVLPAWRNCQLVSNKRGAGAQPTAIFNRGKLRPRRRSRFTSRPNKYFEFERWAGSLAAGLDAINSCLSVATNLNYRALAWRPRKIYVFVSHSAPAASKFLGRSRAIISAKILAPPQRRRETRVVAGK